MQIAVMGWSRYVLTMLAVVTITGGTMGYQILRAEATAGQIIKLVTSDGGSTFTIGRCFRTDIKVQTDSLNANSVDVIIPYNPSYLQPYTGSGCTTPATSIQTDGLFGSYPGNSIASNEINVTAYDPTGTTPLNTGAAPTDRLLGHVYWKVIAASGSHVMRFQFTPGSTTDTNMAQQNGDGTDVLDSVENLTLTLAADSTDPTFSSLSPANSATSVSVTTGISYTFNDAGAGVNTGSVTTSLNRTAKSLSFSSCTTTNSNRIPSCSVTVGGVGTLSYNTLYRVHATGSDIASPTVHTAHQIWTFTTEDDTEAPYIGNLNPASAASGVATSSNIVLHVKDYKGNAGVTPGLGVDISTVQVTVTPQGGSPITYTSASPQFSYTGTTADYTITINPSSDFAQNTSVTVSVVASDLHVPGNAMSAQSYSFTTIDSTAPSISGRSPGASDTGVATTANVVFHVTDVGAGVDIDNTTVTINGTAYTSASAAFTYTGTSADYTVTINPTADFTDNSVVTVTISTQDLASTPNTTSVTYGFLIGTDGRTIPDSTTTTCTTTTTDTRPTGGNSRRTKTILESITTIHIPVIIYRRHVPGTNTVVTQQLSPDEARTVNVCYIDDEPQHAAAPETSEYQDVPSGIWYEDAVLAFLKKGILDGTKTMFRGNDTALRAEFAKVLGMLHGGVPDTVTEQRHFDDVPPRSWYATFIEFAGSQGWMRGYNNCIGTHPCVVMPGSIITRAEAASMIIRFFGLKRLGSAPLFSDVQSDAWYANDMAIAADHCIVQGKGRLRHAKPHEYLNRAEMIVLLDRARKNLFYGTDCLAESLSSTSASTSLSSSAEKRQPSVNSMESSAAANLSTSSVSSASSLHAAAVDQGPRDRGSMGAMVTIFFMGFVTFMIASRVFLSSP